MAGNILPTAAVLVLCLLFTVEAASFYSGVTTPKSAHIPNGLSNRKDQSYTEKGVIERYHYRYPDGSYEFRYELEDGTARYERGYFLFFDKKKTIIVVGYYSYRMSDGRYMTVFYNADQYGYRQNQSITPQMYPNLPRTIEVPQLEENAQNPQEKAFNGSQSHRQGLPRDRA